MIECTNTQSFEEGENCASTILVEQTLGSDMKLFGSDMILIGSDMILFFSGFKFQDISVNLVSIPINFGVKNQVPQVSFKTVGGDLMSFHTFGSDMSLFGSDMILFGYDMILFGLNFNFQEPSVMLVVGLINFGVINQVLQVFFKLAIGDLMLVSSYAVVDIVF